VFFRFWRLTWNWSASQSVEFDEAGPWWLQTSLSDLSQSAARWIGAWEAQHESKHRLQAASSEEQRVRVGSPFRRA
jgi:hypothetical protein